MTERLRGSVLTPSEIDVLKLLDRGLIPKEIAECTSRSVYTVRVHIANAIAKLNCHGHSEAVRLARTLRLI
jgi:DNA-binding CsgD family transcriptional regulator